MIKCITFEITYGSDSNTFMVPAIRMFPLFKPTSPFINSTVSSNKKTENKLSRSEHMTNWNYRYITRLWDIYKINSILVVENKTSCYKNINRIIET